MERKAKQNNKRKTKQTININKNKQTRKQKINIKKNKLKSKHGKKHKE